MAALVALLIFGLRNPNPAQQQLPPNKNYGRTPNRVDQIGTLMEGNNKPIRQGIIRISEIRSLQKIVKSAQYWRE